MSKSTLSESTGHAAFGNRLNWRRLMAIVLVTGFLFACGLMILPIRYLVLGTIYPRAIPLGKPERVSYPLISHYGNPNTMVEFYMAHKVAWYTEDTPEEIETFFLSRGWQNQGSQDNDREHFYKDPTSSWNFGPLTIRIGGWIWVNYDTTKGQVNGKTSSSIFVWVTLDNHYSLR